MGDSNDWHPTSGEDDLYAYGLRGIENAMGKADALFSDPVVFGGVIWNNAPYAEEPPWGGYEENLHALLDAFEDDVVGGGEVGPYPAARFYYVNSIIPKLYSIGTVSSPTAEFDLAAHYLDLEADVCASYAFCSMLQESVYIKRKQQECYAQTSDPNCDDWYKGVSFGNVNHWDQAGLNHVGEEAAELVLDHAAVLALGQPDPFRFEVGVEVPHALDYPSGEPEPIRLDVYDDEGALVDAFEIDSTTASPDWRADFDGDDPAADWQPNWDSLATAFLTFEFVREDGASDDTLARYVYVPTAAVYEEDDTDFFRPLADTGPADARFEVYVDSLDGDAVKVRARTAFVGPSFEEVFGEADAYVVPYNHDHFEAACDGRCPDGLPGYFLARLPVGGGRPDGTERRFTFADEADVVIPDGWGTSGALTWAVDGLVLAFPAERRLLVDAELTVEGATLTEAEEGETWGGVAVYPPGWLAFDGVTVTAAEVGVEVNSDDNTFEDVLLDGNGVGMLTGMQCARGTVCEGIRSAFVLTESCVTNSVFNSGLGFDGYGIWARHADAVLVASTVGDNATYGLLLEDADVGAYRLLLQGNGYDPISSADDGSRVLDGGDLYLTSLVAILDTLYLGENLLTANDDDELNVQQDGYATVGLSQTYTRKNHLALGSDTSDDLVDNFTNGTTSNPTIQARYTYWGTCNPSCNPPAGTIEGPVNTSNPLSTSPSGSAGRPDGCESAGGGASLRGSGAVAAARASGGAFGRGLDGAGVGTLDPEAAAWLTGQLDSLRTALAAAPDSAHLVRSLYAVQRLDRHDVLGEAAETMDLLAEVRAPLAGADTLTTHEREAAEAALVASVHDALRGSRYDDAGALLAPFVVEGSPLPEIEGAGPRHTLALALSALDEGIGDFASAIERIEAVRGELGPEDEQLAHDLSATAAMLARQLAASQAGRATGPTALPKTPSPGSDVPLAYTLGQAYPNPFTGRTTLPFALPEAARVEVHVYDLLGRRVAVLADGRYEAGRHAAVLDGDGLASGVYVVRAVMRPERGNAVQAFTERITLLR